jgi:alcohol dehydrogenase
LLLAHLPASIPAEPATYPARVRCQLAAWMSIFGMNNVPVGLGHALGHQIGAGYDVPHGITSCITLPHVLRFLGKRMPDRLDGVAAAFGLPANQPGLGDQLAERVADFVARLGLPTRLREVGVPAERLAALAQAVAEEIHAREPVSVEDLEALLVAAW